MSRTPIKKRFATDSDDTAKRLHAEYKEAEHGQRGCKWANLPQQPTEENLNKWIAYRDAIVEKQDFWNRHIGMIEFFDKVFAVGPGGMPDPNRHKDNKIRQEYELRDHCTRLVNEANKIIRKLKDRLPVSPNARVLGRKNLFK